MNDRSFVWNIAKSNANYLKHGVSFGEAASAFSDPCARVIHDADHSDEESRWLLIGLSERLRLLIVVHVERGDRIRIISARKATRQERVQYEEN